MFNKLARLLGLGLFGKTSPEQKKLNANKKILIVDDSEMDRKLIQRALDRHGFQMTMAVDGLDGLEKAQQEKFDLILLDCQMPGMQGLDVCKELKHIEKTKDIPVVFLTGVDTPKNVIECFEADAANFLAKPVNAKILTSQIDMILAEHKSSV